MMSPSDGLRTSVSCSCTRARSSAAWLACSAARAVLTAACAAPIRPRLTERLAPLACSVACALR
ncbi:MAG: hypothetical protein U1A78_20555 [Polyangia bacterium]